MCERNGTCTRSASGCCSSTSRNATSPADGDRLLAEPEKVGKTFSLFAFNPAGVDDYREAGIGADALGARVSDIADRYMTVLVEQERD